MLPDLQPKGIKFDLVLLLKGKMIKEYEHGMQFQITLTRLLSSCAT